MYLATGGSLTSNIKKELGNILAEAKQQKQEVVLAFDNDQEGEKLKAEVQKMAAAKAIVTRFIFPQKGKDWTEEFFYTNSVEEQARLRKFQRDLAESRQELQLRKKKAKGPQVLGLEMDF